MTREPATDLEILERLAPPAGRDVADIGCGPGALVRELAQRGARPIGIEISDEQLAAARAADPEGCGGARYLVGTAQRLPLADGSVDVAVFMRSLHHIPVADMTAALGEARRVVREDGLVYVAEPLPEGDYFALTCLLEDELEVRQAAQRALADAAAAGLEHVDGVEYEVTARLTGVDHYRHRTLAVDPERAATFDARRAEIEDIFHRMGTPGERPGERCFVQPMRADVLRPA